MIVLACIIILFAAVRLFISGINVLSTHNLISRLTCAVTGKVSVLIPVRNEEHNIPLLLNDLLTCRMEDMEIILYDDESSDNTAKIINTYARRNKQIHYLPGHKLPEGWIGKNHACHRLAQKAGGDYLLFLDADVRIRPGFIENAVHYLEKNRLHLLSAFPKQVMLTFGERISVPLMNWILLSLLPLPLIRRCRWQCFSAANGQFMLFPGETYRQIMPHRTFRDQPVEDIAIMRYLKKHRMRSDTVLGDERLVCRMYLRLDDALDGFAKNYLHFFGRSIILAIVFAMITSFGIIFLFLTGDYILTGVYLLLTVLIRVLTSLASRQSVWLNLLYSIPQQVILLRICYLAINRRLNKTLIWKERNISPA